MKRDQGTKAINTRLLSDSELDNLMNSFGAYLTSQGFTPLVHSRKLLQYQAQTQGKRGHGGKKSKVVQVSVSVTDLPIGFGVYDGPEVDVPVGLGFGISAPSLVSSTLVSMLAPYAEDLERLKEDSGKYLVGMTFNKRVPGVACDHCGYVQEVTIPISISRVEGIRGYGPGGSVTVICKKCNRSFPVNWDSLTIEIDMTWKNS